MSKLTQCINDATVLITTPNLPHCYFSSRDALLEHADRCLQVQIELDLLNGTGDADGFAIALGDIGGYEPDEIDEMVRTRRRVDEYFTCARDPISGVFRLTH